VSGYSSGVDSIDVMPL